MAIHAFLLLSYSFSSPSPSLVLQASPGELTLQRFPIILFASFLHLYFIPSPDRAGGVLLLFPRFLMPPTEYPSLEKMGNISTSKGSTASFPLRCQICSISLFVLYRFCIGIILLFLFSFFFFSTSPDGVPMQRARDFGFQRDSEKKKADR